MGTAIDKNTGHVIVGVVTSVNGASGDVTVSTGGVAASDVVAKAGDTMTGDLTLNSSTPQILTGTDKNLGLNPNGIGNVGVNTNTANSKLTVNGDFRIRDADTPTKEYRFRVSGSDLDVEACAKKMWFSVYGNTGFTGTQRFYLAMNNSSTDADAFGNWRFQSAPFGSNRLSVLANGETVVNDDQNDYDFRIESDTNANLFFADASTDRIGIGNNAPTVKLDVTGAGAFSGDVTVPDEAYDATAWNGSLEVPTKNAIRDKIEALPINPLGLVPLTGLKIIPVNMINLGTGDTDMYTAPTGKRAMITAVQFYNVAAGAITHYPQRKKAGAYRRLRTSSVNGTGTTSNAIMSFVLEAGESFSVNTDVAGLNYHFKVIEYDNTCPLYTVFLDNIQSGDTTFYTCPSNYSTVVMEGNFSVIGNTQYNMVIYNATGGNATITVNFVPSGGSVAAANKLAPATVYSTSTTSVNTLVQGYYGLNAGDKININSSVNGASGTLYAFLTIAELAA